MVHDFGKQTYAPVHEESMQWNPQQKIYEKLRMT